MDWINCLGNFLLMLAGLLVAAALIATLIEILIAKRRDK